MIIIVNGSVGVGKTTVSLELQKKFNNSIMLDGDFICAVYPFELYDKERIAYLYKTLSHLINFHISNGYVHFIINYIFETNESLSELIKSINDKNKKQEIICIWLTCSINEQIDRILKRNRRRKEWELRRMAELNIIINEANERGFIGEKVDISGRTISEASELVLQLIEKRSICKYK